MRLEINIDDANHRLMKKPESGVTPGKLNIFGWNTRIPVSDGLRHQLFQKRDLNNVKKRGNIISAVANSALEKKYISFCSGWLTRSGVMLASFFVFAIYSNTSFHPPLSLFAETSAASYSPGTPTSVLYLPGEKLTDLPMTRK
ncbi:MAG TPA: hypothetical protein PKV73_18850 [Agriterribacter sp.]|nr:hypothetical protein [Agriterribacter sp.]